MEASPDMTSIIDSKTGATINLMHKQKMVMRVSAEQAKAALAMATGQDGKPAEKAKVTPTGKKEKIEGYDAEEFVSQTPSFTASYWVVRNYPQGDVIMKELQATSSQALSGGGLGMPDFRDFPGLPIRTNVSMSGQQFATTIVSVKLDPLSDAEFTAPADYQEMKMPDMSSLMGGKPDAAPKSSSPSAKPGASPKR